MGWTKLKTIRSAQRLAATMICGCAAIAFAEGPALAQGSALPPVTVEAPTRQQPRVGRVPSTRPVRRASTASSRAPAATQQVQPDAAGRSAGEKANGPVKGYLASQSATATKTDTPILQTPQ